MVPSQFGVVKKKDRELRSGTESRTPFNLYKLKCDFVENSLRANKAPFGASHLRTQKNTQPLYLDLPTVQNLCLLPGLIDEKAEILHSWKIQV